MPQMNFDLEDGQGPVSFVLSKADGDRFMAFMEECTDAIKRRDQLTEELESAQDYAEDRVRVLDLVREKLGVPSEPHQGMDERILEALDALVSNRPAPGRVVEPPPWYVTEDKPWFAYCPEQGLMAFETEAEAIRQGQEFIADHLDECWNEEADQVFVGRATQISTQVDLVNRPDDSELDEDGFDAEGRSWNEDWAYICNYRLQPVVSDAAKAWAAASSTACDDQFAPDPEG
ncbi:hypothetical protein K4A83_11095 [Spirulina subsalsa FACHB-351]|uniref:Uncharacterized protein n=1 Tax=Spirulina subsalsa FACHB-351 TaxID=234711 RepID=A0ABT3L5N7_9CYAN|nr:hypothetical protein [Spirulina subsalsa]MCW6036803.1 hypothetical protein [Spirulina subsalsa FACHB-351]